MQIYKDRIGLQVEPEIKKKAQIQAEKNGTTLSIVIRDFLKSYGKGIDLITEQEPKRP